jgi:tRNA(Arg) A34 adenosine deaminase TadA
VDAGPERGRSTVDKAGAVVSHARVLDEPAWNHRVRVTGGVLAAEAGELLQTFFRMRRCDASCS